MSVSFKVSKLNIMRSSDEDSEDILHINRMAFGQEDEAQLVWNLIVDPSAQPVLSLMAKYEEKTVGHILYTKVVISGHPGISAYLLAPMSVLPAFQGKGIGGLLIEVGDQMLREMGVQLVFVLGHPTYYPKHGFVSDAESHSFTAPYPILKKHANAWMYKSLVTVKDVSGKVSCCQALDKPEYWKA